jgi:hypothetical protein
MVMGHSIYGIYDSKTMALAYVIPSWLVWAEIQCTGPYCSAQTTNKPVQQSKKENLRAYCSYIITVVMGPNSSEKMDDEYLL